MAADQNKKVAQKNPLMPPLTNDPEANAAIKYYLNWGQAQSKEIAPLVTEADQEAAGYRTALEGIAADYAGAEQKLGAIQGRLDAERAEMKVAGPMAELQETLKAIPFLRNNVPLEKIAPPPRYLPPPQLPIPNRPVPRPSALGSLFAAIAGFAAPEAAGAIAASNIKGAIDSAAQAYQDALEKRQLLLTDLLRRWEAMKEHLDKLQAYDQALFEAEHSRDLARYELDKFEQDIKAKLAGKKVELGLLHKMRPDIQAAALAQHEVDALKNKIEAFTKLAQIAGDHADALRKMQYDMSRTTLGAISDTLNTVIKGRIEAQMMGARETLAERMAQFKEALAERRIGVQTKAYNERAILRSYLGSQRDIQKLNLDLVKMGVKMSQAGLNQYAKVTSGLQKPLDFLFHMYRVANDTNLSANDPDKKQAQEALPGIWDAVITGMEQFGPAGIAAVGKQHADKFILAGAAHVASELNTAGIPPEEWGPRVVSGLDALAKLGYLPQAEVERIRANPLSLLINQIPPASEVPGPLSVPVRTPLQVTPVKRKAATPQKTTRRKTPVRAAAPAAKEDPRDGGIMRAFDGR